MGVRTEDGRPQQKIKKNRWNFQVKGTKEADGSVDCSSLAETESSTPPAYIFIKGGGKKTTLK